MRMRGIFVCPDAREERGHEWAERSPGEPNLLNGMAAAGAVIVTVARS